MLRKIAISQLDKNITIPISQKIGFTKGEEINSFKDIIEKQFINSTPDEEYSILKLNNNISIDINLFDIVNNSYVNNYIQSQYFSLIDYTNNKFFINKSFHLFRLYNSSDFNNNVNVGYGLLLGRKFIKQVPSNLPTSNFELNDSNSFFFVKKKFLALNNNTIFSKLETYITKDGKIIKYLPLDTTNNTISNQEYFTISILPNKKLNFNVSSFYEDIRDLILAKEEQPIDTTVFNDADEEFVVIFNNNSKILKNPNDDFIIDNIETTIPIPVQFISFIFNIDTNTVQLNPNSFIIDSLAPYQLVPIAPEGFIYSYNSIDYEVSNDSIISVNTPDFNTHNIKIRYINSNNVFWFRPLSNTIISLDLTSTLNPNFRLYPVMPYLETIIYDNVEVRNKWQLCFIKDISNTLNIVLNFTIDTLNYIDGDFEIKVNRYDNSNDYGSINTVVLPSTNNLNINITIPQFVIGEGDYLFLEFEVVKLNTISNISPKDFYDSVIGVDFNNCNIYGTIDFTIFGNLENVIVNCNQITNVIFNQNSVFDTINLRNNELIRLSGNTFNLGNCFKGNELKSVNTKILLAGNTTITQQIAEYLLNKIGSCSTEAPQSLPAILEVEFPDGIVISNTLMNNFINRYNAELTTNISTC
jgi:hypothetical protein